MFNAASIFHGVSENFFPNNFHKLRVPDNLLRFCISINSRRIGADVIPSDNLYWFITNCGMCDECWSIEDAEPNANFINAVYNMSILVSYVYEIFIENLSHLFILNVLYGLSSIIILRKAIKYAKSNGSFLYY